MLDRSHFAAAIALSASLAAAPLAAATFTVNSPADGIDADAGNGICETAPGNGVCTLRAAVLESNALAGSDIVNLPALPPPGAYVLTLAASLNVTSDVVLNGGGASTTIIDGNAGARPTSGVLLVTAGPVVSISGITLRNGREDAVNSGGGGISIVSGTVTLSSSTVSGNTSDGQGGGIYNRGNLTLVNSAVSGNSSLFRGGGILNEGPLTLVNSTVSGNNAGNRGGGFYNSFGTINLFNATLADNMANLDLVGNTSAAHGAGIYNFGTNVVSLQNSVIVGNFDFAGSFGEYPNECAGTIVSNGNNVMGNSRAGCTVSGGGVAFLDTTSATYLGQLQDNGGPTRTHALLANNPALNGGDPLGCRDQSGTLLGTDQRGFPRPSGASCDAGAFEFQDADGDGVDVAADNCTLVANPAQLDSNGDGYGNICDADLNNSGTVTATDFNLLRSVLNQPAGASALAADADMNGSGTVTATDFNLLRASLNKNPGPSGLHPNCPPACP